MNLPANYESRLRNAWQGRVSGCMLGKPVEPLSMLDGFEPLQSYLNSAKALPLRDYIPYVDAEHAHSVHRPCCAGEFSAALADDDINYSTLALIMLEQHGADLSTEDVARAWLKHLPAGSTYTAERSAYRTLLSNAAEWFPEGMPAEFDLSLCSDNEYNDCIGAQIRADIYGWVCPGNSPLAARLARADAELSHRGEGVHGAVMIATLGAELAGGKQLHAALDAALAHIPEQSDCARAVRLALSLSNEAEGDAVIRKEYAALKPVHTVNNLALVIWALTRHAQDFSAAIGDAVAAGWDTDCNGATVGALWSLQGTEIPTHWTAPWRGRIRVSLAAMDELDLDDLTRRTFKVAQQLRDAN